ncbi:MAG: hypothetical protein ACI9MC_002918, partial [Kiritimatiellia bacterium]
RTGQLKLAEKLLNEGYHAMLRAHQRGEPRPKWYSVPLTSVYENLSALARARGDSATMIRYIELGQQEHRRERFPFGEATTLISLADAHRLAGHTDKAIKANEQAWQRLEAMGSPFVLFPWMNLALIRTQANQDQEALVLVNGVLQRAIHYKRANIVGLARLCRLILHGRSQDWQAWDDDIGPALRDLRQTNFVDQDIAECATNAAMLASPERARPLWELAASQWTALGNDDRAAIATKHAGEA